MTHRWLVALSIVFAAGCLSAASQMPTFSVKTEEVRIDMLVTDNGKPVLGLGAHDFEVRDNGVLQKVEFIHFEQTPISATLVFDMSSSVAGETLENLKAAGNGLLDRLKAGDRAALIKFSQTVDLGFPLTSEIKSVKKTLDSARSNPFGNSSLIDASYAGLIMADSKADRPLLIIFSDGLDTCSWLTGEAVLESAKRSNVVVYAVSAGHVPNPTFLRDLSKITGGSLLEIESTKNLNAAFLGIINEFRQRYLLTYSPLGVSDSGWHRLEVRIKNRKAKVLARSGYLAGPAD
jgi:Ca-activated chloride channel homolog